MTHTYRVRLRCGKVIEVSAPTMPVVRDGGLDVTADGRVVARLDGAELMPGASVEPEIALGHPGFILQPFHRGEEGIQGDG